MDDFFQTDFDMLGFDNSINESNTRNGGGRHNESWTTDIAIRNKIRDSVKEAWKSGAYANRKITLRKHSAETIAKMRLSAKKRGANVKKGFTHSAETIAKMSLGAKNRKKRK